MGTSASSGLFMKILKQEASKDFTENGAVGYTSTAHGLTDFNFKLPSFRGSASRMLSELGKVYEDRDPHLLKYLFYLRDCREGIGERETFRRALSDFLLNKSANTDGEIDQVLRSVPLYGRWDDLFAFFDTALEDKVLSLLDEQLKYDIEGMNEGRSISLLAKWMPSDNASSKKSRYFAHKIVKYLKVPMKAYRKTLVSLRKYLDVLEVKACSNNWAEIDYNRVPSNANLKYKDAFMKHDPERRKKYLDDLEAGKDGVKINSKVNFPHEVVHSYRKSNYDAALEQLWKNLPDMPGLGDTLVIRDGSGSMSWSTIPGSRVWASEVADALSIYCAERCSGELKDTFITFSSRPQLVSLKSASSLWEKLEILNGYDDCSNTDIEATFDLLLSTAIKGNLKQEDMPKSLLVISDMEFDQAHQPTDMIMEALFTVIRRKYEAAGYKLPKLVFWNVNSRTDVIPVTENECGVLLVSGFSANIVKMVTSGKTDPYDALLEMLSADRYKDIPDAVYRQN